jgi:hypothetical protein
MNEAQRVTFVMRNKIFVNLDMVNDLNFAYQATLLIIIIILIQAIIIINF